MDKEKRVNVSHHIRMREEDAQLRPEPREGKICVLASFLTPYASRPFAPQGPRAPERPPVPDSAFAVLVRVGDTQTRPVRPNFRAPHAFSSLSDLLT